MSSNRYDVLASRKYTSNGEERTAYTKIGVAFPLKDKDGFSINLDAMPAPVDGQFRLVMMPPLPARDGAAAQRQSAPSGYSDPDIPF